jgi:hypothetical protein
MKTLDRLGVLALVTLILIAMPFLATERFTGRDPVTGKKRWTNIFGVVVMLVFVMAILVTGAVKWTKTKAQVNEAIQEVNYVADSFAEGKGIDAWAKGAVVDPWDNGYILLKNDPDGVQMLSKGPDGEEGTEDDITSEVFVPPVPEPPEPKKKSLMEKAKDLLPKKDKKPEKEDKPSLMDRAKGWFSKD